MKLLRRSYWPALCAAVELGCLLVCPLPTYAQSFVEVGGGWSYMAAAPPGQSYSRSYNFQASIGSQLSQDVLVRFDAFVSHFAETVPYISHLNNPCPIPSCGTTYYNRPTNGVAGLTADALANLDARGILYVLGGAGFYDTYGGTPRLSTGLSVGAGVAVPIAARLRLFAEARSHFLFGANRQLPWLAPITVGFRY